MKLVLKLLVYLSFVIISFRLSAQTNQIGPTGKVGIGTDNPSDLLHVKFDPAALGFSQGIRIQTNYANFSTGRGGGIVMQNADVNTAAIFGIREENNWKGALTFYTHTSGSGNSFGNTFTEKMRLTNVGNLGIGTTSPDHLLSLQDGSLELYGSVENSGTYSSGHHGAIQIYAKGNGSKFEGARIEGLRRGGATDQAMSLSFFVNTGSNLSESMRLNNDGNVGIGTPIPDAKLTVKGNIHTNEVKVDLLGAVAPDYVFADDYHLRSLEEVENYTNTNSHLPEIPSAVEMAENGVYLKEMNMKLLQKVEELTLYLIEEHKQNKDQQKRIEELEKEIELLKSK